MIDSAEVVRYHLKNLGHEDPRARYLSYSRLEDCFRPRQLRGWARKVPDSTLRALENDACMVTGMEGPYSTLGLRQKAQAWSALLSLGRVNRPSFDRALQGERNGFAISEVLDIAACLRSDPLPSIVVRLLTKPREEIPDRGPRLRDSCRPFGLFRRCLPGSPDVRARHSRRGPTQPHRRSCWHREGPRQEGKQRAN
jgi:hypothetical protein